MNGVYEIDALLARGGMGEVYKGHSIQTGDDVAIKVIRADLAENEIAIALFRNEASKLHRLHHEAIIRYFVFSIDPQLNRTYLAMEFVEGEPLSDMVRRGPLPVESVRRLAQRIALGLSAAHKRDIIHRDVSSDNIIIQNGDVDEAKIIDFGIAHSTQVGTTFIDVGFAGKFNYVSPEQLGLYGGDVTARSDIYSLGLVLLEALQGEPADMGGTQVEVIEKRKNIPSLAAVDPRVRPIIEKMLQPDPNRRPQSMQAVADDFAQLTLAPPAARAREAPRPPRREARQGSPQALPQASRPEARQRALSAPSAGRRPALWIGAAAGGTLALIALAGGAYVWLSAPVKRAPPPEVVLQPPAEKPATTTLQAPPATSTQAPPPASTEAPPAASTQAPPATSTGAPPATSTGASTQAPPTASTEAPPATSTEAPPATGTEAPATLAPTPAPPPPNQESFSSKERALNFINRYAGGPCFSIISAAATDFSAKIEGVSASRGAFDELNAAFQKAIGFEADIQAILIQTPQCAALEFYNSFRPNTELAPQVRVDTPFVRAGQPLTGSISAAKDRKIETLLVGDDGLVQNVTNAVTTGRLRTFSLAAPRPKGAGQPQLLMFVSSAHDLSALKLAKPAKAAQAFPALAAEARDAHEQLGVAMRYFYVTD